MHHKHEFLFFGKDESSFLESYYYDLAEEDGRKGGQIFINLEIQNNPLDAEEIGAVLFETVQTVFFEDLDKSGYERFEDALKAVNNILNEFKQDKISGYIGNLNVIVAAVVDDELFLTQTGDAEAYLVRNRFVSVISEGLSDENRSQDDVFSSIANGRIDVGDHIIFSSVRLLRYLSKSDFVRLINANGKLKDMLADIQDAVSTEILGRVGLTGIEFLQDVVTKDPQVAVGEMFGFGDGIEEKEKENKKREKSALTKKGGEGFKKLLSGAGKIFGRAKSEAKKYKDNMKERSRSISSNAKFASGSGSSVMGGARDVLEQFYKNKYVLGLLGAIVALILIVWFVSNNSVGSRAFKEAESLLLTVEQSVDEARTKSSYDKDGAKKLLDQASIDAMKVYNSGHLRNEAKTAILKIDDLRDTLDGVARLVAMTPFIDLKAKNPNIQALGFIDLGDRRFVYDAKGLYELVLDQVQDPLNVNDQETIVAATDFEDRNSIIFLTKTGKIIEYREGNFAFVDTSDGTYRQGVAIEDWGNRIYLMDKIENQIWRYQYLGISEQFGEAQGYFTELVDLSNANDFAIDASLFLLRSNGDIDRYLGGGAVDFSVNAMPLTTLKNPKAIVTSDILDNVYVLDSEGARVLVYQKDRTNNDLNYLKQYLFEGIGVINDITIDSGSGIIYLLTSTAVYQVSP